MQRTELCFVIQRKINKHWHDHIAIRTGIRQHNYTTAYRTAQRHLQAVEQSGVPTSTSPEFLHFYLFAFRDKLVFTLQKI